MPVSLAAELIVSYGGADADFKKENPKENGPEMTSSPSFFAS